MPPASPQRRPDSGERAGEGRRRATFIARPSTTIASSGCSPPTHSAPPAQLDAGLAPAFLELGPRAPAAVEVNASAERFEPSVEAAAHFIGCEALANAGLSRIGLSADRLLLAVVDDGIGGSAPGMA